MDYRRLTAPCGRDCFNCPFHLAKENEKIRTHFARKYGLKPEDFACQGCRDIGGKCKFLRHLGFSEHCKIHACVQKKGVEFCCECADFPCDLLHPLADGADKYPHNLKVFNLCLIGKMGVEAWAANKALKSFETYYKGKLDL